jgi:hypothetical protein
LALSEEREVVTVQMDWVRGKELVLDHKVDPLVRTLRDDGNVLSIGVGGVGGRARGLGELRESCHAGVDIHGVSVQVPAEDGTIISSGNCAKLAGWEGGSLGSESTGGTSGLGDDRNKRCYGLILANTGNITGGEAGLRAWEIIRSTLVLEDAVGKAERSIIASRWAGTLGGSTEEVGSNGLIGLNNNIVTLSERDVDKVSCVRLDWDKVGG